MAAGEAELTREAVGDAEERLRTGLSQAGEGRPVPSGTRGESTGMLQTVILHQQCSHKTAKTHCGRTRR
jgi:hypothetical protein